MHRISLQPDVVARVARRRGAVDMFARLAPRRTALLAIDMQNLFLEPGAPLEIPFARALVPGINRLARTLREAGGTVVWVRNAFDARTLAGWSVFFGSINTPDLSRRVLEGLAPGSPHQALWPELDRATADMVADKDRYSAFHCPVSTLDRDLRARGIDTVLIAGTLTNVCCETTARDAMQLDYKVVMLADGCATRTDAEHNASLTAILNNFGDVATIDQTIGRLAGQATPAKPDVAS
ncbi:MAG: cysteine hydrolase [Alphaproteobacteria bacterium]|nr:cysteine hydrolase [Alphaproteobacteria bacterium]